MQQEIPEIKEDEEIAKKGVKSNYYHRTHELRDLLKRTAEELERMITLVNGVDHNGGYNYNTCHELLKIANEL